MGMHEMNKREVPLSQLAACKEYFGTLCGATPGRAAGSFADKPTTRSIRSPGPDHPDVKV